MVGNSRPAASRVFRFSVSNLEDLCIGKQCADTHNLEASLVKNTVLVSISIRSHDLELVNLQSLRLQMRRRCAVEIKETYTKVK